MVVEREPRIVHFSSERDSLLSSAVADVIGIYQSSSYRMDIHPRASYQRDERWRSLQLRHPSFSYRIGELHQGLKRASEVTKRNERISFGGIPDLHARSFLTKILWARSTSENGEAIHPSFIDREENYIDEALRNYAIHKNISIAEVNLENLMEMVLRGEVSLEEKRVVGVHKLHIIQSNA